MILLVTPTAGLYGGTERVLELLLSAPEAKEGFAVAFLEDGPLVRLAMENKIPFRLIQRKNFSNLLDTLSVIHRLRSFVREVQATVVFAWTDFAQLYAAPAAWRLCPSVWWQRTNVEPGMVSRLCHHLPSRGAIANSRFTRDQLRSSGFRVAEDPLYPPFESDIFRRDHDRVALREELGIPAESTVVGSVGRLQTWKGFDTFVEAIARLRRSHPNLLGLIVGGRHDLEAEYEKSLQKRIEQLDLTSHLLMVGSQRNVAEWMASMDVFVHAAHREPFGIVVPEAMALGLPVIASIPGGPEEVIEDGVSGLLVESGDVSALEAAVSRFLLNPRLTSLCGIEASQRAGRFGDKGFVDRLRDAAAVALQAVSA